MSGAEWISLISIGVGAAVALWLAQKRSLEETVGKRLDTMQDAIEKLTNGMNGHNSRITRIETIIELNGCGDHATQCTRKQTTVG